ncbi:efflux RND transporter periplasmic adaptor subunit [Methylobacterium trifolii]|nr:efflux RND transporter periplasmic adaptor subunit [Methylobacterium trifolii]
MSRKRGRLVLLGLVLVGWAGYVAWAKEHAAAPVAASAAAPAPVPVVLAAVEKGPFDEVLGSLGTVQAFNTVQVRTRVDGEIQAVAFKEGQTVAKGDVLVQVDPRPYQASFDQARAKKTQDESTLKNARADLERYTKLGDYASRQQTDTQSATVNSLTAQVASDQAAIDNAQTQLGYATIRAPFDGVAGFRQVDVGNIVNASAQTAIVTITQVEPIFVVLTAPEDQLREITAALAKGTVPVEAWSTDGQAKLSEGRLALINNQVDTATGTIRLKAVFANTDHALWPGLSVSTRMRVGIVADALTVPDDAVQHGPEGLYAFVVDAADTAHPRPVKVGRSGLGRTRVLSGLTPGEQVIVAGQARVLPGARVVDKAPEAAKRIGMTQPSDAAAGVH